MLAARDAQAVPGVLVALALTATPVNQELVANQGFEMGPEKVRPNDVLLAVRAETQDAALAAERAIDSRLDARGADSPVGATTVRAPTSLRSATQRNPALNLAFVAVPGQYAAYEIAEALEASLDVFCFSSGVPVSVEALLKQRAREKGLLLMGPDCGTAIVDGVGFGFANAVRRGPVGIVAASGTGIQEVACLLDTAGIGISHAIGVGSHDLSSEVGGEMTLLGLELLQHDEGTDAVVLISKPPDPEVANRVSEAAGALGKPTVVCFLGQGDWGAGAPNLVTSLEGAARRAAQLCGGELPPESGSLGGRPTPGDIRGLFSGGSLCFEAMGVVSSVVGPVASNIPLEAAWGLEDVWTSRGHTFIDFGEESLTDGRLHPMIDPSLRNDRFTREAHDPSVGVVMLDVVLGFGAHRDPSHQLAPLIESAIAARSGDLSVVVAVCGAAADPQDTEAQIAAFRQSGAIVTRGVARAARLALSVNGHSLEGHSA
jgi:FdrA protein